MTLNLGRGRIDAMLRLKPASLFFKSSVWVASLTLLH
jgi:hypothetical protein